MTRTLLLPLVASSTKGIGSVYFFAKSVQKFLVLKTKGLSEQRLSRLVSINHVLKNKGLCSIQQMQRLCAMLLNINSSSLKFWFTELSLVGLGFRFSVKDFGASFRLNVGYSHAVLVPILPDLFLLKRKKRCLIVSSNLANLRAFATRVLRFRKASAYKLKGLQLKGLTFKLKPGKRSK